VGKTYDREASIMADGGRGPPEKRQDARQTRSLDLVEGAKGARGGRINEKVINLASARDVGGGGGELG